VKSGLRGVSYLGYYHTYCCQRTQEGQGDVQRSRYQDAIFGSLKCRTYPTKGYSPKCVEKALSEVRNARQHTSNTKDSPYW
jgi:hypothetical protein